MPEYNQIASWISGYGDSSVLNYKDMEGQSRTIETSKIKRIIYGVQEGKVVFKIVCFS